MTDRLYYKDSYLKEFEGIIEQIGENGVVIDRTAFYPGGGGQPSDRGYIILKGVRYPVINVSTINGKIVHEIIGFNSSIGEYVTGLLDWERRYQLMRTHTALHIICGVIWREFQAHVTGSNMKPLEGRIDFELESISSSVVDHIEELINNEVKASRGINSRFIPRDEAFKNPELVRTKINLLPEGITEVRIVEIDGLDVQADGGTHVSNTNEVGSLKIVAHESKGKINKRLRIALGD
ncbi:MAG: Ala-tRNA(Pro) hydrolase [Dehalococcoidia bacterium]|nr:Ala-tRNA(Pro) hydrolase [Dehalococcoidia bacterium]|tara:strand:+ start:2526 stop:3236 length:711 start_codon:yes stop_codon:yes gene_type:complete